MILLASSVGLPYFALSATSPLLQSWLAARRGEQFPYRLFALSNAASLLALLAYPAVIEPFLPTRQQMVYWSGGYVALLFLLAAVAVGKVPQAHAVVSAGRPWLWIALAACAATLWLAIANYLGQQVGAMPFLWVVPMAIYLLSFILCFEADGWYRPALFRWLMPVAWIAICSRIALEGSAGGLGWEIPILSAALFICCMFCHGELARSKPPAQKGLPFFYLMVAAGGAAGRRFCGGNRAEPLYDFPGVAAGSYSLGLSGVLPPLRIPVPAAIDSPGSGRRPGLRREHAIPRRTARGAHTQFLRHARSPRVRRGRCGSACVVQRPYDSRAGIPVACAPAHADDLLRRAVGRGAGAQSFTEWGAARGDCGSRRGHFGHVRQERRFLPFLRDQSGGDPGRHGVLQFSAEFSGGDGCGDGDGRLMLDGEPRHSFDIVVLDAFSDDAVPVHLLTRQAFEVYFDRLRPGGLLLIHLSNRYLDLSAEVEALAAELHKNALFIHSDPDPAQRTEPADWAIVADNGDDLAALRPYAQPPSQRRVRPWTDEYSSLLQLWK